jgi:energy-coupling factor transport system substrate-specific component
MASFIGFVAFLWPFVVAPGTFGPAETPPLMFGALLVLILAVVFAEIADGRIDAKALAMLGVLSAINAALRPLGAGTAGIETVFFVLVLAGRVYGPGFGFALGCTSLFTSALITGGVGPWMPYQMFGCAWVGMFAGLLPAARGRAEIGLLAGYAAVAGYGFGFMLNLSFWPFSLDPGSSIAYQPGLPVLEQIQRYLVFFSVTSLGWDTGRAVTTAVLVVVTGPAVLAAFRRAARRANFHATAGSPPRHPSTRQPPQTDDGDASRLAATRRSSAWGPRRGWGRPSWARSGR